jgi:hypothetical protein
MGRMRTPINFTERSYQTQHNISTFWRAVHEVFQSIFQLVFIFSTRTDLSEYDDVDACNSDHV